MRGALGRHRKQILKKRAQGLSSLFSTLHQGPPKASATAGVPAERAYSFPLKACTLKSLREIHSGNFREHEKTSLGEIYRTRGTQRQGGASPARMAKNGGSSC